MAEERRIPAGRFKAECLKLMDEVQDRHVSYVITKRGRPVARLVPLDSRPPLLFGYMKGSIEILGDIVAPIDVEWDAARDD